MIPMYQVKRLVTRNTHVKYGSPISYGFYVMANVLSSMHHTPTRTSTTKRTQTVGLRHKLPEHICPGALKMCSFLRQNFPVESYCLSY